MRWMLDTNTCIYIMKHHPPQVQARLRRVAIGVVGVHVGQLVSWWREDTKEYWRSGRPLLMVTSFLELIANVVSGLLFVVLRGPFQWLHSVAFGAFDES